jgi:hypothetical protein
MYWVIVGVLGIGVFAAYFGGVRAGRSWGTPLLMVCVIGLLGAIGYDLLGPGSGGPTRKIKATPVAAEELRAERLGALMMGELPAGAAIRLVWAGAATGDMAARWKRWEKGLKTGLEDETIQVKAQSIPRGDVPMTGMENLPPGAREMRTVSDADAVVYVSCYGGVEIEGAPLIAVYFGPRASGAPSKTSEQVQTLVDEGQADVALLYVGKGIEEEVFTAW